MWHNTHWTSRGALAGSMRLLRPMDIQIGGLIRLAVLSPLVTVVGGDLARMLGIEHDVLKRRIAYRCRVATIEKFSPEPFATFQAYADRPDGETIMVIG